MFQVTIPRKFYDDHVARDRDGGTVDKVTSRKVTATYSAAGLLDLIDDARYFAGLTGVLRQANLGLVTSAKATLAALASFEVSALIAPAEEAPQVTHFEPEPEPEVEVSPKRTMPVLVIFEGVDEAGEPFTGKARFGTADAANAWMAKATAAGNAIGTKYEGLTLVHVGIAGGEA